MLLMWLLSSSIQEDNYVYTHTVFGVICEHHHLHITSCPVPVKNRRDVFAVWKLTRRCRCSVSYCQQRALLSPLRQRPLTPPLRVCCRSSPHLSPYFLPTFDCSELGASVSLFNGSAGRQTPGECRHKVNIRGVWPGMLGCNNPALPSITII